MSKLDKKLIGGMLAIGLTMLAVQYLVFTFLGLN